MSVSPKVRRTPFSPHSRHRSALHALQCQREGPRLTSKHAWQYHGKRYTTLYSYHRRYPSRPFAHQYIRCVSRHNTPRLQPHHGTLGRPTASGSPSKPPNYFSSFCPATACWVRANTDDLTHRRVRAHKEKETIPTSSAPARLRINHHVPGVDMPCHAWGKRARERERERHYFGVQVYV